MKEKIEDIAKSIKRHRELELTISASNKAIARSKVKYNGQENQFWITNSENKGGVRFIENITGSLTGTEVGNRTTITEDGPAIYKNTRLGEILIRNHQGNHSNSVNNENIPFEIFSRAIYTPSNIDGEYANEITIQTSSSLKIHSFRTLLEILKETAGYQKDIEDLEKLKETASEQEAKNLVARINEKENEKKAFLEKAQNFIRKSAELRYQPILDPQQEEIKRSNIFDGTLIINGGPGTGKTTSLIQRIKFLIDIASEAVGQDYLPSLNLSQKVKLSNQLNNWIFFSPNELLALYLMNNMKEEGLIANNERVKVWSNFKTELVKAYRIVNTETKRPFLFYNKQKDISLFATTLKRLKPIISGFERFYIKFQNVKLERIKEIDVSSFKWKNVGLSIQNYINRQEGGYGLENLIRLFSNLDETFAKEISSISNEYIQLINSIASQIQVNIQKDKERETKIEELLRKWKIDSQTSDEDEQDELDLEEFEESENLSTFDFERTLFIKLKSAARKQALKKFDKNTKQTKRDKELLEIIPELQNQEVYDQLGQLAYFKKYFERISKGLISNIFREIPMIYKQYRRAQLKHKAKGWNIDILEELVKKDENKRIHSDEQALLLFFINGLVNRVAKSYKRKYEEMNHSFINGYKNYCKPVIGVDEATDFHLIDLLAIYSMGDSEISSVTFSGDVMQRMTKVGLSSWDDLVQIIPKTKIKNLQISYRQSSTLLDLAKEIYRKSTGIDADYSPHIERHENEPRPLMFISENSDSKIEWIADRVHDIYKAYGDTIPSIAIFLPKENQLEDFAEKLGRMDTLADVGIQVRACKNGEVLGDKNTIRIFSIDAIKGLEFEAVFFYNMDELQKQNLENELFLKYIYVGLSRATFYLGLLLSKELESQYSFLNNLFDKTNSKNWELI